MKQRIILILLFTLLMSMPWLVPGTGFLALVGFVPLLVLEHIQREKKHLWWQHYLAFVLWNAVTTWWVANATVGGAIFAVLANALQMSLVFGTFRWVKRRLGGVLPYVFLAAAWIAWEKYYLTIAEISWPWLVLGNAFADTTGLIQWYSVTGSLGGSLWVWVSNLAVFGLLVTLSDRSIARWTPAAKISAFCGTALALLGPVVWSLCIEYEPSSEEKLAVVIGQPNLDPYEKFESLPQEAQDRRFLSLVSELVPEGKPSLVIAPETFTASFMLDEPQANASFRRYRDWLGSHPDATLLFGASAYDTRISYSAPGPLAYDRGKADAEGRHLWLTSRNSAIATDTSGRCEVFHKSKLVVGVELTPYPAVFVPLEKLLGGNLMGKNVGQEKISCLHAGEIPFGTAVCYESVYGEYCTGYVKEGAQFLAVITNDAWWGDTPGYRQHFNYSRLRAIETRRWIARCGNTGISAIIDPQGSYLNETPWWKQAVLAGYVGLETEITPFVRYGDMTGRVSVFLFLLLSLAAFVRPRLNLRN